MNSLGVRLRNLAFHAKHLRFGDIAGKIARRVYSNTYSYCLRRDLTIRFPAPDAKISIAVRRLEDSDVHRLFADIARFPETDQADLHTRLAHIEAHIPTCWAGVTDDDAVAYIQWLMGPDQNEKIQAYFNGTFPVLAPDEALLENALTLPDFRGKAVMPAAMTRIAEQGEHLGARYVITFVERHNIASLKGCKKSGFVPYMMRHERWLFFRRSLKFRKLAEGTPYPFDAEPKTLRPGAVEVKDSLELRKND